MSSVRYMVVKVERETEKAVRVRHADAVNIASLEISYGYYWFPKSQIEVYHTFESGDVALKVPAWLVKKNGIDACGKKIIDQMIRQRAEEARER